MAQGVRYLSCQFYPRIPEKDMHWVHLVTRVPAQIPDTGVLRTLHGHSMLARPLATVATEW